MHTLHTHPDTVYCISFQFPHHYEIKVPFTTAGTTICTFCVRLVETFCRVVSLLTVEQWWYLLLYSQFSWCCQLLVSLLYQPVTEPRIRMKRRQPSRTLSRLTMKPSGGGQDSILKIFKRKALTNDKLISQWAPPFPLHRG